MVGFSLNSLPGKGYVAFRTRLGKYPLAVIDDETKASMSDQNPFVPTKPVMLFPFSYAKIQAIDPSPGQTEVVCDFNLKAQPNVQVEIVGPQWKAGY